MLYNHVYSKIFGARNCEFSMQFSIGRNASKYTSFKIIQISNSETGGKHSIILL